MSPELERLQQGSSLECNDGSDDEDLDDPPAGLDLEKFDRGRQFFQRNLPQCLLAMFMSLICGLSVVNLLETLVATGVTREPRKSVSRYLQTALHVVKWHYGNVWDLNSDARKSLRTVRRIHHRVRQFMVRKLCPQCGRNAKFNLSKISVEGTGANNGSVCACARSGDKDSNENKIVKVYLSQYDMSLVQCGFMGAIILHPQTVGLKCSESELDDYVYFWRWIGHLLGINDANNVCFGGYKKAYSTCKAIEDEVLFPAMIDHPEHFYDMAKAITDGMNILTHSYMYSPESYFIIAFRETGRQYPDKVGLADRLRVWLFDFLAACHRYIPGYTWCTSRLAARMTRLDLIT